MKKEFVVRRLVNIALIFVPVRQYRKRLREKWRVKYQGPCVAPEAQEVAGSEMKYLELTTCPDSFVFPASSGSPLVSIIIPVYNQYAHTKLCLWSILNRSGNINYEIIIGDDCSSDETRNIQEKISNIKVVRHQQNKGFLDNCNSAAAEARGKYVLFLNNDTQVQEDWLKHLVSVMEKDEQVGLVGSKMIFPDNTLQEAGGIVFNDGNASNYCRGMHYSVSAASYLKEADYVSGCSIMLRKVDWEKLGGFDKRYVPAYYEDTDLCFSVREVLGKKVIFQPLSVVMHFEGISCGTDINQDVKAYQVINKEKFYQKWKTLLEQQQGSPRDIFHVRDRSLKKKTLLFIDYSILHYTIDAGSRASFQYLEHFVREGYNVKFLPASCCDSGWAFLEAHEQLGVEVLHDVNFEDWIKENGQYVDYVYLNRPNITLKVLDLLQQHTPAKLFYQGHDLHHLRLMRQYEQTGDKEVRIEAQKYKEIEMDIFSKVDVTLMFSTVEIEIIRQLMPGIKADTVPLNILDPSGMVDIDYNPSERKDIMFIGGYGHQPNADAVLWFVKEVLPKVWLELPELKFNILGSRPTKEILELESNRVHVWGTVSDEELAQVYRSVRMSVIPLRFGAGVKGKVVEAVFNKVPVLTTSIGAEGIDNDDAVLTVEDEASSFADRLIAMYRDEALLSSISSRSEPLIRKSFSSHAVRDVLRQYMEVGAE